MNILEKCVVVVLCHCSMVCSLLSVAIVLLWSLCVVMGGKH